MAKRQSLSSFSPAASAKPDGGTIETSLPIEAENDRKKYHSVSVYLTAQEIRTLKLLNIETGKKMSDICALAIREWMERNGHARSANFTA